MHLSKRSSHPLGAALLALAVAAPAGAQQGVTFTYEVHSTTASREAKAQGSTAPFMAMTVSAAGPNMRIEFRQGAEGVPMMKPGSYMLIRGEDKTFAIVNPEQKAAVTVNGEGFGGGEGMGVGAGRATNNAVVKVSQKDSKFDWEDLGAGEKILGIPTRHVRVKSSGTSEVRVLGKTQTSTDEGTADIWIATKVPNIDASALRAWSNSFGRGLRRTNPGLVDPRAEEYQQKFGEGLALRTVMVVNGTDDKGRARTDTLRAEITELKNAKFDASQFEIPKDYQTVDMRGVAKSLDSAFKASGMDTLNAGKVVKDAAKEAGKDAAKEAGKDAVKNALGGFLHRKKP